MLKEKKRKEKTNYDLYKAFEAPSTERRNSSVEEDNSITYIINNQNQLSPLKKARKTILGN